MEEFEIKKKCQGKYHRVRIRMENGEIAVSCPDHDFDLDEIQEAMESCPASRNFCNGVYAGWTGMRDVTLDQVHASIAGAKSHGLTSNKAREIFGYQVAELLYLGIRSPIFAKQLLDSRVWPTKVPFDLTASEHFVQSHPEYASSDFAVTAMAGGIGFDKSDIDWLGQESVDLRFAVERLYEPAMWRLMTWGNTRDELNTWWRAARSLVPGGNGRLVIHLVSTLPSPLTDLDLASITEIDKLTLLQRTQGILLAHRLITDFNICDVLTLVAIIDAKWSLQDINGLSISEVRDKAQHLLRRWEVKKGLRKDQDIDPTC
jgi:hypothetical protein